MKILVAPLDWGLGHATRCIPIISGLTAQGNEVIIAVSGKTERLLKQEFPGLKFIPLKGYHVHYSSFLPTSFSILFQVPKIIRRIIAEHRELKKIIRQYQIEMVISDNRYGLWSTGIHSVFITHQVMIKCPKGFRFMEPLIYRVNRFFISRFNECWIPDDENKLSGDLSHSYPLPANAKLIGPLSRWNGKKINPGLRKYDVIAIISGPEPYSSSLEKILVDQLTDSGLNALIVQGKPGNHVEKKITDQLHMVSHLDSKKLLEAISVSELVICRPGYSSIMDLISIKKNAILIPTPGQTEQIYLADYLRKKKVWFSIEQKKFTLRETMRESINYSVKNYSGEPVNSW